MIDDSVAPRVPPDDRRERISTDTGRQPYWVSNRQIVYRSTQDDFFSVELTPDGRTLRPSRPVKLFNSRHALQGVWQYSVDARGEKFLMVAPPEQTQPESSAPLTVVVNWVQNLKRN